MQMVGPILAESAGPLPADLQAYLDAGSEDVVYASMVRPAALLSRCAAETLRCI